MEAEAEGAVGGKLTDISNVEADGLHGGEERGRVDGRLDHEPGLAREEGRQQTNVA